MARSGAHAHGARFVADARGRGAVAVLCEDGAAVPEGLAIVRVGDVPCALAFAAAAVYGHPSFSLEVVGITGTNGKTTTTHLVRAAIDGALGAPRCGIVGTVGHGYDGLTIEAAHTTPEPDELARVLAAIRDRGATHVAMEVSSIALATGRVRAVRFRVAAFTNLTQDHLDFHGTMESYAASKAQLFTHLAPGVAVIHVDDPFGRELANKVRAPLVRVSTRIDGAEPADIAPTSLKLTERGIEAVLRHAAGGDRAPLAPPRGAQRREPRRRPRRRPARWSSTSASATAALANELGAPGRLERCEEPEDDVTVLVDYAHTPDALARALDSRAIHREGSRAVRLRLRRRSRHDQASAHGRAAAERADAVLITNDNPRSEAPEAHRRRRRRAGARAVACRCWTRALARRRTGAIIVELDRGAGDTSGGARGAPGDVVLIAGKGHENYQIVGDRSATSTTARRRARALAERRSGASVHGPRGT